MSAIVLACWIGGAMRAHRERKKRTRSVWRSDSPMNAKRGVDDDQSSMNVK